VIKYFFLILLFIFSLWSNAHAAVRTSTIEYLQGKTELEGFLVYDDSHSGRLPGILIMHDWWGIGQFEKQRAEQLAQAGFVVFVADLYGKGVHPQNENQAIQQSTFKSDDIQLLRDRAKAGLDQLKLSRFVNPDKISAIGYSFGGGAALELARTGADLKGVVIYYARFNTQNTDDDRNIKGKVLLLQGAADPFIPSRQLLAFKDELEKAKVDYRMVIYGSGVKHNFANPFDKPSKGAEYNAEADKYSSDEVKLFLQEILAE
jgi:dienelactone hydrolase